MISLPSVMLPYLTRSFRIIETALQQG